MNDRVSSYNGFHYTKFIIRKIRKETETETETENINMEDYIYYGYDEKGNVVAINLF